MILNFTKGGVGSGNHNHTGRPGVRGGSGMSGNKLLNKNTIQSLDNYESERMGNLSTKGYASFSNDKAEEYLDSISTYSDIKNKAIKVYESGGLANRINNYLRDDLLGTGNDEFVESKVREIENAMDDILPENTVLTRLVSRTHPLVVALKEKKNIVNTVYTEENFVSTSMNLMFNTDIASSHTRIRILAPKGTSGLAFGEKHSPAFGYEMEFLLPRNSSFLVKGFDVESGLVVVELIENN